MDCIAVTIPTDFKRCFGANGSNWYEFGPIASRQYFHIIKESGFSLKLPIALKV